MAKLSLIKYKYVIFITIITIVFLLLLPENVLSQVNELGQPLIKNFTVKEYGLDSQNFSVTQDDNGVMYFGNLSGVLRYDELNWELINVHGWPFITCNDSGVVYVGSFNNFGYIGIDENGDDKYFSLKNKFIDKSDFGVVTNIVAFKDNVFFETGKRLYHYYSNYVFLIDTNKTAYSVFRAKDKLFVNHSTRGLLLFKDNQMMDLPMGKFFAGKDIVDILPMGDNVIIKLKNELGFLKYDFKRIVPFHTKADEFLQNNTYTSGQVLSDGSYALGTNTDGIVFVDKDGNILLHINKLKGLNDNGVYSLFVDKSNNLWAVLRNGISRIEYPSAFTYFSANCGVDGGVIAIKRINDKLYIGTLSGLFLFNRKDSTSITISCTNKKAFSKMGSSLGIVYNIFKFKDKILAVSDNGLYEINGLDAKKVLNIPLRVAKMSKLNPDFIYIGGDFGFSCIEYSNGQYKNLGKLSAIKNRIRTFASDNSGNIWCGTNNYGVFRVSEKASFESNWHVEHFSSDLFSDKRNVWVDVIESSKGVIFSSEFGLYRYNNETSEFYPDTILGINTLNSSKWLYPIVEDKRKDMIVCRGSNETFEKEILFGSFNADSSSYKWKSNPFRKIDDFSVEAFLSDEPSVLWIGGPDGLIRFDASLLSKDTVQLTTLISKLTLGDDSIIRISPNKDYLKKKNKIFIEYDFNKLKFSFVCPAFMGEKAIEYKIFLKNFDDDWSEWSLNKSKEYNLLPPGDYIFMVKARDIYGHESNVAQLAFTIITPFYRTIFAFIVYFILLVAFYLMFYRYRSYQIAKDKNKLEKIIKERTDELLKEIERAQGLLLNMLPHQIAQELILKGKTSTKKFELVSVMFSDIQGFTKITEIIKPDVLVKKLDELFLKFDTIIEKHRIEKIKTIGDGYMCAGGIPEKDQANPVSLVLAALEIREYMKEFEFDKEKTKNLNWGLRIGIDSGPVIAGVIGTKKYSYDIWGVTVNTASRLESNGTLNQINISETTYNLIKDYFICEYNGKLSLKTGSQINMYFVKSIKPEFSEDGKGKIANKKFSARIFDLRYNDLYDFMIEKLKTELPQNLYYHNVQHTIDVCKQVEIIGKSEGVSCDEMLLLKTAALFHDSGFTIDFDNHELHGFKLAKEILPHYHYSNSQIEKIGKLIMATRIPPKPKNLLEKIICDADLDYLGRRDFIPVSRNLFMELYERKKIKSVNEWLKTQIKFIEKHTYFTQTALNNRDVNKKQQLDNIKKMDFLSSFF